MEAGEEKEEKNQNQREENFVKSGTSIFKKEKNIYVYS